MTFSGLIGKPKHPEPTLDLYFSGLVYLLTGALFGIFLFRNIHDWPFTVYGGIFALFS